MWLDRINIKKRLSQWLTSRDPLFVISVNDSQELEDIRRWVPDNCNEHRVAWIHYNSDVDVFRHHFLGGIIEELGVEHFENYFQLYNELSSAQPVFNINQFIGNQSKSKGDINYESNQQTVTVDKSYEKLLVLNREENISELFKEFSEGIQATALREPILLLLSFGGDGLAAFSAEFKRWYKNIFCEKISNIQNLKICIISKGDIGDFKYSSSNIKKKLTNLCREDVIEVAKEHVIEPNGFVHGIVDEDNTVQYKMLKLKIDDLPEDMKAKKEGS